MDNNHHNGQMVKTKVGILFESECSMKIRFEKEITLQEMTAKISQKVRTEIHGLCYRWLTCEIPVQYCAINLQDDDDVQMMIAEHESMGIRYIKLFAEVCNAPSPLRNVVGEYGQMDFGTKFDMPGGSYVAMFASGTSSVFHLTGPSTYDSSYEQDVDHIVDADMGNLRGQWGEILDDFSEDEDIRDSDLFPDDVGDASGFGVAKFVQPKFDEKNKARLAIKEYIIKKTRELHCLRIEQKDFLCEMCENPKNDLLVCLLGCVVFPPKNGVGHSRDDLVKLRVVEGDDDVATGSRRGEDDAMPRSALDPSCDLGYRLFPATLETSKFGWFISIVGNIRLMGVMIRNFKELKEPDRVFSKEFTSKVRDSRLWVRLESGSGGDEIKWWRAAATKSETAVDIGDKGCYSSGYREEDLMLPTSCWSMSNFESCMNEGVSVVTTLNLWRMYAFSGRKVKEMAYKEEDGILLQQRGLLLAWPLPYSRSCLQALLVLVGEVIVGDKQWFSSESFYLGHG
ncbi:hypothetical protein GQ457_04G013070 [Hibiscus cannabinus]